MTARTERRALPVVSAVAAPGDPWGRYDAVALAVAPVARGAARPGGSARVRARPGTEAAVTMLGVDVAAELVRASAAGRSGEVTAVPVEQTAGKPPVLLLLVGVGDGSATALRRAGAALAHRPGAATRLLLLPGRLTTDGAEESLLAWAEGLALGSYRPLPPGAAERPPLRVDVAVAHPPTAAAPLARAAAVARAVWCARDLANTPANTKSPQWLADRATHLAARGGCRTAVVDAPALAAAGFGGLTAVGAGSVRPPRFVRLDYTPAVPRGPRAPHIVLVGKGIVFDTGGISLKPAKGMELMKTDMAGAAVVVAVMSVLHDLRVPVRVTGLLAVAENSPGAGAMRPGDVIWPYGGRSSVEVVNTDAEGRLVLADALGYADLELDPDAVVDLATLTGAATQALGRRDAALFATDERLARALGRAAEASGERVWRLPLTDDYRPALDSGTADLVNAVTDPGVGGGAITAALFLREFTGGRPWAHLDIAGTARSDTDDVETSKGATGFGVRLLLRWLVAPDLPSRPPRESG
jgi:leucyl aminopeptidase